MQKNHQKFFLKLQIYSLAIFRSPLIFVFFTMSFFASVSQVAGQVTANCVAIECEAAEIRVSQKYANMGCSLAADCNYTDLARQMTYSVDIYYTLYPVASFEIGYENFSAQVTLSFDNSSPGTYSRINKQATLKCNEAQLGLWTNELFSIDPATGTVILNLMNQVANTCPEDKLIVTPLTPNNPDGKVHLFDVVVDAYPGEVIKMECTNLLIEPQGVGSVCELSETGQPLVGVTSVGSGPFMVPVPTVSPSGSIVGVSIAPVSQLPNGDASFKLLIRNKDVVPTQVDFLDFLVNINFSESLSDPIISPGYNLLYDIYGSGISRTIRFHSETPSVPFTMPPGATFELATIVVSGPAISNKCWSAAMTLPQDNKAQVKTNQGCVSLSLKDQTETFNLTPCTPECTGAQPGNSAAFVVQTVKDSDPCKIHLKIGFVPTPGAPITSMTLSNINFSLSMAGVNNFTISNVDFGALNCTNQNICANPNISGSMISWYQDYVGGQNIDYSNGAFLDITLSGDGCIGDIILEKLSITGINSGGECLPQVLPFVLNANCTRLISGALITAENEGIQDATVCIYPDNQNPDCNPNANVGTCGVRYQTTSAGAYGNCDEICGTAFNVQPYMDIDPLNGVNTWDLVLISRHILNLEPLNSPYKIISADANNSKTITSFDIVELRKLILGTYTSTHQFIYGTTSTPLNSWRFVDAAHIFTNQANPFADVIREQILLQASELPRSNVNFIGCKIGDVDFTATPNNRSARPVTLIDWPAERIFKAGDTRTVPVLYQGETPLDAVQFGIQFDPSAWELVGPSSGDIFGVLPANFGLSKVSEGKIAFSWNMFEGESMAAQPGEALFYLTFKAKGSPDAALLQLDPTWIPDGAWDSTGKEFAIAQKDTPQERTANSGADRATVVAIPNPAQGASALYFDSRSAGKCRMVISDAFGRQLAFRDIPVGTGQQEIALAELTTQPSGVYSWWIKLPDGTMHQGRIVKQ